MAGVMDPWANDHLLPPPPPNFDDLTTEQQFDYFRACGILPPPHPPAGAAVAPAPGYYTAHADGAFLGAMEDRDVKPFAAFFAAQQVLQHLAAEEEHAATFWDAMDDYDVKPPSASDVDHAAAFSEAHQFLPFGGAVAPPAAAFAAPFAPPAAAFWPGGVDYYYDDVKPPSMDFDEAQFLPFGDALVPAAPFPAPFATAYPAAAAAYYWGAMDDCDVKPPSTSNVHAVGYEAHFLQSLAGVHGAAAPFPAPFAPAYPAAAVKEETVAPAYIDASLLWGVKKEEQ